MYLKVRDPVTLLCKYKIFFSIFRAKNMSSMAFAMYQFTKGEGRLNTTQDLFTQAEYFAEEANRLYKIVRQFSYQVRPHQLISVYFI